MTAPAPYTFDTVFPGRRSTPESRAAIPKFTENDLAAARETAYQEGLAAGRREVADQAARVLDQKIEQLLAHIVDLQTGLSEKSEQISGQAAKLAFASARILAKELIDREPEGELLQLFEECVAKIKDAPHLVIQVPQTDLDSLRERITGIAAAKGYEGKIVLMAEDGLQPGDCRIEWADGGISRDFSELENNIRQLVETRFASTVETEPTAPDESATSVEPETEMTGMDEPETEETSPEASLPTAPQGSNE